MILRFTLKYHNPRKDKKMFKKYIKLAILVPLTIISCSISSNQFLGNWAFGKDENVEFTILDNNQIKYFEDEYIYNYSVANNILSISDSGKLISSYQVMKVSNDSLVLKAENKNILRYVKID